MIFVFLSALLVNIILYYHYRWAYYRLFTYIPNFCLGIAIIAAMLSSLTLVLNIENKTLSYKDTISEKNIVIDNFAELKTASNIDNKEAIYAYTIKNNKKTKTISIKNDNIYSIFISKSRKDINCLTIKHNAYFNWATFTTTQKDDYIFSSK